MARRLAPEVRRAEIVAVTLQAIAEGGYRDLSLREVARRCGMTAPGLTHYFASMPELLEAVLDARDEVDLAALFAELPDDATLVESVDTAMRYYDARMDEVRQFDALEIEALDPLHPAHEYFEARTARTAALLRPIIEREFADPEGVQELVSLTMIAMRLRMLRDPERRPMSAFWLPVRDVILSLPRRVAEPPGR